MSGTLVDSNVLLDVLSDDPAWFEWSRQALEASDRPLVIDPIIYAEVSAGYGRMEDLDLVLPLEEFVRAAIPYEAAFLAEKVFVKYRKRGGKRVRPLADFFIGAHAAVAGLTLLTRDARRYRKYFPTVELIAP